MLEAKHINTVKSKNSSIETTVTSTNSDIETIQSNSEAEIATITEEDIYISETRPTDNYRSR